MPDGAFLCREGTSSRTQVRGAAFVREEKRGNPGLVRELPSAAELAAAGAFELEHVGPDLDDFYLVVLRKPG